MKDNTIKNAGIVFLFLLMLGLQPTHAQFWKKLEKRAAAAAEEAVLRKAEDKAVEKTENAMDSIFDAPNKVGKKNSNKSKNEDSGISKEIDAVYEDSEEIILSDTYDFEWKYAIKMESAAMNKNKKNIDDMKMTYYLNTDTAVFGMLIDMPNNGGQMGKTIMIMDVDNGTNLMLMEMNGQKIMQKMPSITTEDINEAIDEDMDKNYTVEKTDTKVILGYDCQGFKITTEDGIVKTYIANHAPVSFNKTMSSNSNFKPKGFDSKWLNEFENGLMMEMEFISAQKEKYNMKMTCVALEKAPISLDVNEYKSFMEMGQ